MPMNLKGKQYTKHHLGCELKYSRKWDAYLCVNCDEWAEPKCKDADCEFCAERPDRPTWTIA